MTDLDLMLHKNGLRKTAFRMELLNLLVDSNSSLTVEEIKKKVGATNEKVTIYRALESFEKNGLIHKVPDKECDVCGKAFKDNTTLKVSCKRALFLAIDLHL